MIGRLLKAAILCTVFVIVAGISAYFTLSLIIKSEDTVIVPDFVGRDVVGVLEKLTELGLNTKVKGSEYSAAVPKNHVIYQEPKPGAEIKKGRDVKIIFSKGPKVVMMPNLAGLPLQQAQLLVEEHDLCRGVISSVFDARIDKDGVIAQAPEPGKNVQRGACADLLVSLGPRPRAVKMPDLIGLQLEDALLNIEQYRLSHGGITSLYHRDKPDRSVIKQEPPAGYRVTENRAIELVVNRHKSTDVIKIGTEGAGSGIFRYTIDNGFLRRHIRVQFKSGDFTSDLFDDFVRPGREIWLFLPHEQDATVLVYEDDRLVRTEMHENW